jgi:phosphatidylglycerophosphate synthase
MADGRRLRHEVFNLGAKTMRYEEYSSPHRAAATTNQKIRIVDRSLCKNILRTYHFQKMLDLVPLRLSPIKITLIGFITCGTIPITIIINPIRHERALGIIFGIVVYVYLLADHLDGMQAKRTGAGTVRGATLDHLCDFFNGWFILLGGCYLTNLPGWQVFVFTVLYVISFTIFHLEAILRAEFWLGDALWLGRHTPLEMLIMIMTFFLFSGVLLQFYFLFIIYFLYKAIAVIVSVLRRLRWNVSGEYVKFLGGLALLAIVGIIGSGAQASGVMLGVIGLYSGTYVLALIVAGQDEVPNVRMCFRVLLRRCIFLIPIASSAAMWLAYVIIAFIAADLIRYTWRLPAS